MLTLDNIAITRNGREVISNFSVTIFPGTCLVISGKNGSGKTTLLKHLSGINNYGSGYIYFNNIDVSNHIDEYHSMICHVGHNNALSSELTVSENLNYWANINNRVETVPAALSVFGLYDLLEYPVGTLSQGWQRKVALTRLLLSGAEIWYLDEPYANLDIESCEALDNMISAKTNNNGIVVIASHKPEPVLNSIYINLDDITK
jgi:heme exporter protein A